jgi:hypothetical protein
MTLNVNTDIPGRSTRYDLFLMAWIAGKIPDDRNITEIGASCQELNTP